MKRTPLVVLLAALLLSGLVVSAMALGGRTAAVSRAVVKVAFNTKLKKTVVVDGSGRTLYMFTEDTRGTATCTPQGVNGPACPMLWPPLTSQGAPLAGKDIKASLLGITKRTDGKRQVTYNRHPLYYYHGGLGAPGSDKKPGDVQGQNFFYSWYVLSPRGTPIRTPIHA